MKRIVCLLLAVLMSLFCFVACDKNSSDDKGAAGSDGKKTYTVGICQLVQHEALDAATQGFEDALKEKLGDRVTFDPQNASGEATNCTTIVSKFVSDNVDLIMANATGALTAAAQSTADIPIVATSITDYATALGIKDWTGKTGFNVTGTADLAPLDQQAAIIKELFPDAKNVGILYCSAEPNSQFQSTQIQKYLTDFGFTCKEYTFVDTNDVTSVTQQAVSESDVIFAPTDNTVASNSNAINNVAEPAKVPIVAGEAGICKGCGIATLSISYYDIGYKAGEMAYEILENGADPADMEIEYAKDPIKSYVPDRCKALGITVPDGYEAMKLDK